MMKLSRRGLFGAGAGAAIAGPSMAKEAIASMGNKPGGIPIGYAGTPCAPMEDPNWFARRRAELERAARGDLDEEGPHTKLDQRVGDPGFDRIDGLKSVSLPVRRIMANDLAKLRDRERRMEYAAWELRDLLKRYGPKW